MRKIIVDQRQKEDFEKGHLPGAINIPMQEEGNIVDVFNMEALKNEIKKDDLVLIYCYGGDCAKKTVSILTEEGYGRVINIGGYDNIKFESSPMEKIQSSLNDIKEYTYNMLLCYGVENKDDLEGLNYLATVFDNTLTCATFSIFPIFERGDANVKKH